MNIPAFRKREESDLFVRTDYRILFEDPWLFVIEKPAPLPVHAVGRFREKNLLSLLEKDFSKGLPETSFHIVNRLDSETSGLVLVAKDSRTAGALGIEFEKRRVQKEYLALVFGVPDEREGEIAFGLGWRIENHYHVRTLDPSGEPARTLYQVVEAKKDYALLKIRPLTGRTHQIRAHLAFGGHPVVGDKVYLDLGIYDRYVREGWSEEMRQTLRMERLALHASKIRIRHPRSAEEKTFESSMPEIFSDFLARQG